MRFLDVSHPDFPMMDEDVRKPPESKRVRSDGGGREAE